MRTITMSHDQFHDIIRALDEARVNLRMEALKGEKHGNEEMAAHYYAAAERHENLILALQAQA